jgi:hypothetical protein
VSFAVGTRVEQDPAGWVATEFDGWGRGVGVGVVVEPPYPLPPGMVDVRWPGGRCFEPIAGLRRVGDDTRG